MSDTSISNVMAIRAEVIARSRALREAQPTAPPGVTPTAPASNFADTLNAVVAKVNETQEQEDVVTEAYERGETTDIATENGRASCRERGCPYGEILGGAATLKKKNKRN